jgi:hypothetical protein
MMILNTCRIFVRRFGKTWAGVLLVSMMLLVVLSMLPTSLHTSAVPPSRQPPSITINTVTQDGNLFTVKGVASFSVPAGQTSQYHVQVVWEHNGSVVFQNDYAEIPPLKDLGEQRYEYDFADSRTLNTGGEWTIRARLYHVKPPGNDNQANASTTIIFTTFMVTITTKPEGLKMAVDGEVYTSPQTFAWLNGSKHTIGTFSPQSEGDTIYTWVSWSDGGEISHMVTAVGDATYTAFFKKQYLVCFNQTGLDSSATGVIVTVNGSSKSYDKLPFSNWYDENDWISYSYAETVNSSQTGKRFKLNYVTGPASPFQVSLSTLVIGSYTPQYLLTVETEPDGLTIIPGGGWYDANSLIILTAPGTIPVSQGIQYRFSHWSIDGVSQGMGVNPITVSMNTTHTATAHYVLQYYLTVESPYGAPSPGSGWFDAGTSITASVTSPWPPDSADTRSVCTGWVGTGSAPSSGTNTEVSFTINAPSSITWSWKTQYRVAFIQTGVDVDFTGVVMTIDGIGHGREGHAAWYDVGASIDFNFTGLLVVAVNQKRYVLTSVNASTPLIVTGPLTVMGSYRTQYYLTMITSHGTVSPGDGWFDAGSTVEITAAPPPVVQGERYVWMGWTGTGSGSYTGMQNPAQITVNSPIKESASWKHQYYLAVNTPYGTAGGEDWYDEGSAAYATVAPLTVDGPDGVRYVFSHWSGDASGTASTSNPITMNAPKTAIAIWKTQYRVVFNQNGLDETAVGTVVTVNGSEHMQSSLPFTTWVDSGASINYGFESIVLTSDPGKRFRLNNVTGPETPFTVTGPVTVTGNYVTQWRVVFTVDPPGSGTTVPSGAGWYDAGIRFSISAEANPGFSFSEWTVNTSSINIADTSSQQTSVTVNGQGTVTACFTIFYTVSFTQIGLPTGVEWSVTFNGVTKSSTSNTIVFSNVQTGDYAWSTLTLIQLDSGTRYLASPSFGTLSVPSQLTQTISYTAQYRVEISWSGLDAEASGGKVVTITVGGTVFSRNVEDAFYEEWVNAGTTVSYAFEETLSTAMSGKRFSLHHVSGTSASFSNDFGPISGPVYETAYYKAQYYITVISDYGSPTSSTWVDEGTSFIASVTSPAETMVNQHQWVCTGFKVDENPVQEGSSYTFVNVQTPHTIVFYWKKQFWIQVNSNHGSPTPSQWVDQGGSLMVSVTSPTDESEGVRYRCKGYTIDSNPPVEDGSTSHFFSDVQSAHTITFNWIAQYKVTFYTNPVQGTVTVRGVVKNNGESEFYDDGESIPITANPPSGYWFSRWTVTGGVAVDNYGSQTAIMMVSRPGSLSAIFVINAVSITITSSPVTGVGFIKVDGVPYNTPVTFTWVTGTTHVLEAVSIVPGATGIRYVWKSWSDSGAQMHVYTVPSMSETVTACFSTQYYLTVISPHDTPGGSGWYEEGSIAYATLETRIVVENGVQYVFTGWSGDASGTSLTSNPIMMNGPKTAVANWATSAYTVTLDKSPRQGVITVDGVVYTSLPVVLNWVPGSSHTVMVPSIEEAGGTRYVFREWSDGSTQASRIIVAEKTGAVYVAYYNVQHRLTVYSDHGLTTGSGWYDEGVEAVFSVTPTIVRDETEGVEYTFKGWVGSGAGKHYTGPDNPARVIMTGPVEEKAEWEPSMYCLKVVSEYGDPYGSRWYPVNSEARFGVNTPVNHGNGTMRVFLNWFGDISLREPVGTLIMVRPYTVIANWDTQYLVVYNTTAPNGVLLSVPGVPQTLAPGFNVYAQYYSAGSRVKIGPAPGTVYATEDTRYCFEGWMINGEPVSSGSNLDFTVDKPLHISMTYGTEILLTVNVVGANRNFTVKLTVEKSPAYVLDITPLSPFKEWVKKDTGLTLTVSSPNKIGRGEWAVFREWSGDAQGSQRIISLKASRPITVNAVFFAVNPVAESIPYSLLTGIVSIVLSRLIRRKRAEEPLEHRSYSPILGIVSLTAVLTVSVIVSISIAMGYGINVAELPDLENWAVLFTGVEAIFFLVATLLVTRRSYPGKMEIPVIYPNPYGI